MNNSWICIDASLVVHLVLKNRTESPVFTLWEGWLNASRSLAAPSLLYYEVSNALHRYAVHGDVSLADADRALEAVLDLHISVYGDADLHRHTVRVARRCALMMPTIWPWRSDWAPSSGRWTGVFAAL